MRFSELLATHMIPEWKRKYICYGMLKSILSAEESKGSYDEDQKHLKAAHKEFFRCCENELTKVTAFYSEKLMEAKRKMAAFGSLPQHSSTSETEKVQTQTQTLTQDQCWSLHGGSVSELLSVCKGNSDLQQLRLVTSELHLSLVYLQSYQQLNYSAFCKIMKKYDSKFVSELGQRWKREKLDDSLINTDSHATQQLMDKLEALMCHLEGEDRQRALRRLRIPQRTLQQSEQKWIMFRIGVICGLLLILFALILIQLIQEWELVYPLLRIHRGSFLLLEFLLLLGLSMLLWQRSGVNHVLIFQLDPREHLSHQHLLQVAGAMSVCWCCSVLASMCPPVVPMPRLLPPLLLYALLLLFLINPTPTCYARARRWLRSLLLRVLTAPLWPVAFSDCWLADQLNSLSPLFLDLWHLFCSYSNEEAGTQSTLTSGYQPPEAVGCGASSLVATCLIQCFPPWLRLAQCLRQFWDSRDTLHLLNAGKYSTVFLMVLFAGLYNRARAHPGRVWEMNAFVYLWAVSTCFSVLVCVSWDLRMDWTLLQGHGLLRRELLYTHEVLYYGGMLLDVLLRVCWAVNILLAQMRDSWVAAAVSSVLGPLEVLRRCVWNMFRLESEQLRNCELTRAVRDVDFPESSACLAEHVLHEWRQDQEVGPGHQQHQNLDHCRTTTDSSCTHLILTCLTRVEGDALSVEETEKLWLKCVKSEDLAHG